MDYITIKLNKNPDAIVLPRLPIISGDKVNVKNSEVLMDNRKNRGHNFFKTIIVKHENNFYRSVARLFKGNQKHDENYNINITSLNSLSIGMKNNYRHEIEHEYGIFITEHGNYILMQSVSTKKNIKAGKKEFFVAIANNKGNDTAEVYPLDIILSVIAPNIEILTRPIGNVADIDGITDAGIDTIGHLSHEKYFILSHIKHRYNNVKKALKEEKDKNIPSFKRIKKYRKELHDLKEGMQLWRNVSKVEISR